MNENKAHEGMCLTNDESVAEKFSNGGTIYNVEIDLVDFVVEHCDGYDHDENFAPADSAAFRQAAADRGVDILVYNDEDESGWQLDCYRIVSDRAINYVNDNMKN